MRRKNSCAASAGSVTTKLSSNRVGVLVTEDQAVESPTRWDVRCRLAPFASVGQERTKLPPASAIFRGQQGTIGGRTLTVKLQVAACPRPSVTVQVTVVTPTGNSDPE